MRPTRHRFTISPKIQGRIAGDDLRLLVSSGLPVMKDAAPFSPISDPKIVGQFLLLCGSPRVMQLGLNVETGEVGAIGTWSMANGPRKIEGPPPGPSRGPRPAFSAAACVPLLMRAAPGCATPPHVAHLSRLRQGPAGRPSIPKGVDEGNVGMNVYVKCFEIPDRLRASLNPDECEVLEVDGVPFIDEYGVFSPLDGLRIDSSGRYLLFCESKIDSLVGIDLVSHHVVELIAPGWRPYFANSTLGQYVTSFRAFTAGLPYAPHDIAPDDDTLGAAAQQFRSTIKDIDPRAAEVNTMWDEVSWDIANGDWQ